MYAVKFLDMKEECVKPFRLGLIVTIIIGLTFLWTGSAFLSWVYNVADLLESIGRINMLEGLTEGVGYVFQAIGIMITCVIIRQLLSSHAPDPSDDRKMKLIFAAVSIADLLFSYLSACAASLSGALIFGYVQNTFHGIIAALYIYMLTLYVDVNRRGLVFGLGYSIGSLGSYFISIIGDSNFLADIRSIFLYVFIVLLTLFLIYMCSYDSQSVPYAVFKSETTDESHVSSTSNIVLLAAVVVILLSLVKGLGFYFDFSDVWVGGMSLEYTRMFYATGLIVAGLINDINRRWGGIICVAALVFPFVLILLNSASVSGTILWILNYSFTGLYVVYRVLLFSDIAWESLRTKPISQKSSLIYLAPLGLMFGRIGDVISTGIGLCFADSPIVLNILTAIMFVIAIIVFLALFSRHYLGVYAVMTKDESHSPVSFCDHYKLTDRESIVLMHITDKMTNKEIASELFVQESTVKYHVKNILKKTGCSNRQELKKLYSEYNS